MRRFSYQMILGAIIGLAFAALRALPFFFAVHIPKILRNICDVINAPGLWAARVWSDVARLPSGGELGRQMILPSAAIIAQWVLIAVLVGLFLGRKKRPSGGKQKSAP